MLLFSIFALLLPALWWLRFVPTDIAGCQLWCKADGTKWQDSSETTPATADADPVGAWVDGSGNSNDLKQTVSGNRAQLKLALYNGLPAIRFDGSASVLKALYTDSQPTTLFIVYNVLSAAALAVLCDGGDQDLMEIRIDNADTTKFDIYAGSFLTQTLPINAGTLTLNEVIWNGGSSQVWQNKVSWASGNVGTAVPGGIHLGAQKQGAGYQRFCNCDICEVIQYNTSLGTSDRQSVENYLDRWFFTPPPPPTPGFGEFQATFEEGGSMLMPTTRSWGRW